MIMGTQVGEINLEDSFKTCPNSALDAGRGG